MRHKNIATAKAFSGKFIDNDQFRYMQDNHLVSAVSAGVKLTGHKATTTGAWLNIIWDALEWEYPTGWWTTDSSTTKQRLYIPYDGYYAIVLKYVWQQSIVADRRHLVRRGSDAASWEEYVDAGNDWIYGNCMFVGEFLSGDYAYIQVLQDSGGNLNFIASSKFAAFRLPV